MIVTHLHPLAPYVARLDAAAHYTTASLAEVTGLAVSSVRTMALYGWLPGAEVVASPHGGRGYYRWSGATLRETATTTVRVELDHDRYDGLTLWRAGCRCEPCRIAHNEADRERRRAAAEAVFPPRARRRVVALVRSGVLLEDAAAVVGVSVARVRGVATWDAEFAAALDEAGWALCRRGPRSPECSTAGAYRGNNSFDPCRGTGCLAYRREEHRRARA